MVFQQGRRESSDCGVFPFHPPTPSGQRQLCHRGYVAGRRTTENDVLRRYSSYLASPEVIDIVRTHSILDKRLVYLHRFIDLIRGKSTVPP